MYKSEHKRLEVASPQLVSVLMINPRLDRPSGPEGLSPTFVWAVIRADLISQKGFRSLEGLAPAGDMARQLQEYLDSQSNK